MNRFWHLVRRDVQLAWREGGTLGTALGFYLVVVAIMPLGLGPDLNLLGRIAPGVLWVGLLLSALLSIDRIFFRDVDDGTFDLFLTGPLPLEVVVAAKSLAHWLVTALPLALMAPLLGLLLNLPEGAFVMLLATTLVGTPAISFLGAVGAALTLPAGRGGLLLALLMLPFFVPVLVFGVSAVDAAVSGPGRPWPPFLILSAITLASLVLSPIAAAAALRMQLR